MQTHIDFVQTHFRTRGQSGDEVNVLCPFHADHNASMRINVAKGMFFCHGCHAKGNMRTLARKLGVRYSWNETESTLGLLAAKLQKLRSPEEESVRYLPESTLERFKTVPTGFWTDPMPEGCGFTEEIVDVFDLGYDPIADCAIIPVRDIHGRLLGVTRRFLLPDADVKYKDPKGFQKSNHLFGSWLAIDHPSPTVVLVEGPKDAMKVWQAGHCALAQYGSYITPAQIKLLRRMGTTTVVLFYDNDNGGRIASSAAMGVTYCLTKEGKRRKYDPERDLRKSFIVKKVSYRGAGAKDPGALREVDIDRMVRQSTHCMA